MQPVCNCQSIPLACELLLPARTDFAGVSGLHEEPSVSTLLFYESQACLGPYSWGPPELNCHADQGKLSHGHLPCP